MRTASRPIQTRTFDLGHQQLLILDDGAGTQVDVLLGGVWLTEERQLQDRFAAAGQALGVQGGGRTVVEAIGCSRVRVVEPERGALATGWRALTHARQHIAALMPRALAAVLAVVLSLGLAEAIGSSAQIWPAADPGATPASTWLRV